MTPACTAAANDNRPAAFDARLTSYMPGLRRYASVLCEGERSRADELVGETMMFAIEKWANFRGDPSAPKSGFYGWLRLNMLSIWQAGIRRSIKRRESPLNDHSSTIGISATQEVAISTRRFVTSLLESRDGAMMVSLAMGETLEQVGVPHGVTRERVRQLANARRKKLGRMPANDIGFVFARKVTTPKTEF